MCSLVFKANHVFGVQRIISAANSWPGFNVKSSIIARHVSTSNKKPNSITTEVKIHETENEPKPKRKFKPRRDWQSFGWDLVSEKKDLTDMHSTFFFIISGLWLCTFIWFYYPDLYDRDWVQREAFIQLRRREALGLPLIDPNYADPENLVLPTDEELGDTDIII